MSTKNPIKYRGHSYIRIVGCAGTPQRFWDVKLLTTEEYLALPMEGKAEYRPIYEENLGLLELHFGRS